VRRLGLDIGERRIGVAVSDPSGRVATPLKVLDARELTRDSSPLRRLLDDYEVGEIVVGLPLTMAGEIGPQAEAVKVTARRLLEPLGVPVTYHDERLSSSQAARAMAETGADARSRARDAGAPAASPSS